MGLKISSIARLPITTDRDYFVYFLDYGWDEPLSNAMYNNFNRMAEIASENKTIILAGLHREHFANEVLSWHRVNGEDAQDILPAIMITDADPRSVADSNRDRGFHLSNPIDKMIILPLKKLCRSESDVTDLLSKIAKDIIEKRSISEFEVQKLVEKSEHHAADMIILKPSVFGVGIDLVKAFQYGKDYWSKLMTEKRSR